MRVIIAGSRTFDNYQRLKDVMENFIVEAGIPEVIISGCAKGADKLGEAWAAKEDISIEQYPAKWELHGKAAGIRRNYDMAANADVLIAFWDGKSRGTEHMIAHAREKGLRVEVITFPTLSDPGRMRG